MFVASMLEALLGTSLIFIYPTLVFRASVVKSNRPAKGQKGESRQYSIIAALGVAIGGGGAKKTLRSL